MGGTTGTLLAPASGSKRKPKELMRYQISIASTAAALFITSLWMETWIGVNSQLLQPDNRCFLQDGGSTLTFFVKEDLPVGQQIGRLNIQGRVGRDIDLAVNDINDLYEDLPVTLEGEDLVLAAPLDKENKKGVDSILIDVVCQRKRSSDPAFNIPVHVRVTDVNDNPPLFAGAPFNLSLSELTQVGSKILSVSSSGKTSKNTLFKIFIFCPKFPEKIVDFFG